MAEPEDRITRDDIESRLRDLKDVVEGRTSEAKDRLVPVAVAGGILFLVLVFLLGRRAGRKRSTIVEIRRI